MRAHVLTFLSANVYRIGARDVYRSECSRNVGTFSRYCSYRIYVKALYVLGEARGILQAKSSLAPRVRFWRHNTTTLTADGRLHSIIQHIKSAMTCVVQVKILVARVHFCRCIKIACRTCRGLSHNPVFNIYWFANRFTVNNN